ncbi:MAG: SdpI family protein [Ruminococcus sp.]|nr:SdpI family protein [Ruminococcus sp.]
MFEIIFIVIIIIPIAVSLGGVILIQCAKSDIDSTVGYRTKRSMARKETWIFANRTCGRLWLTGGIISVIFSVTVPLLFYILKSDSAGLCAGVIIVVLHTKYKKIARKIQKNQKIIYSQ